jgi:hypothetical protein
MAVLILSPILAASPTLIIPPVAIGHRMAPFVMLFSLNKLSRWTAYAERMWSVIVPKAGTAQSADPINTQCLFVYVLGSNS